MNIKIIGAIILVALAAVIYYFFFMPLTGVEGVKDVWSNHGIDIATLDADGAEELAAMSDSELNTVKAELQAFEGGAPGELADVYIALIEFIKASKKVDAKNADLNIISLADPCSGVTLLKERNQLLETKLSKLETLSYLIESFERDYPTEAAESGLTSFDAGLSTRREGLNESKQAVELLETSC